MDIMPNFLTKANTICQTHENHPLAGLSTFKIGGNAELCAIPKSHGELASLLALAKEYGVTFESEVVDPWKKAENAVVEYKDAIKKAMSDTSIETNNYPGKSGSTRFTNTGESMSSVVNADTRTALSQWSPVFSASYYAEHNPDVVAAVGYDEGKLLNHFLTYGQKEGRKGNDVFDVASYALANPDLVKAFGGDLAKYYQHYIQFGKGENRKTADKDAFNAKVYADRYPDLKKAFGYNYDKLLSHYLQ